MKWSVAYGSSASFCDKDVLGCIYRDTCNTWGFGKESTKISYTSINMVWKDILGIRH